MHKCGFLLFGRGSVEELEQGDFLIVLLFLLALYAIADAFTLYDDRSAVIGFGKGQHIVVRKAYALSDFKGYSDSSSFAEDTVWRGQRLRYRLVCSLSLISAFFFSFIFILNCAESVSADCHCIADDCKILGIHNVTVCELADCHVLRAKGEILCTAEKGISCRCALPSLIRKK